MVGFIAIAILAAFPSLRSKLSPAPKKTQDINKKSSTSTDFESIGKPDIALRSKPSESITKKPIISNSLLANPSPGSNSEISNQVQLLSKPRLEPVVANRTTIPIKQTTKKIIYNRKKEAQDQARVRAQSEPSSNTNTPAGLKIGGSKDRTSIVPNTNSASTVLSLPQNKTVAKIIDVGWSSYGPLKVTMAKLIFLKGKGIVAPAINENGRQLYLAFNCENQLLNRTGPELQWGNWYSPNTDAEKQLIRDICKSPYVARLGLSSSSAYKN